jgi:crossover junction endodeoxyribonuclease RuvC
VIRSAATEDVGTRLAALAAGLDRAIATYHPDVVAVERVFSQHNVRTVMGTAQAAGVAILVATMAGLPVALHTPSEVKAAVTGSGRADKPQVTTMVTRLLGLAAPPSPADAADALALAICHIWRGGAQARLDRALSASRADR